MECVNPAPQEEADVRRKGRTREVRSSLAGMVVGWCTARVGVEKDTVVEEKTKVNRVPGSSAGGAGQEELLRGKKDV